MTEVRTAHTADFEHASVVQRRLLYQGKSFALTPAGVVPTEDEDGGIYVLPVSIELDVSASITCDWRDGDVW